jgi:hypothetical protein
MASTISSARRYLVLAGLCLVIAAGCDNRGVIAPSAMKLSISNQSTLTVTLVVNGTVIETIAPGQVDDVPAQRLSSLPWNAKVLSPSGRDLLQLTVHAGDVRQVPGSFSAGPGARIDLSCGRIDLWSGPGITGPGPGPGTPGDCAP